MRLFKLVFIFGFLLYQYKSSGMLTTYRKGCIKVQVSSRRIDPLQRSDVTVYQNIDAQPAASTPMGKLNNY